jgi:hypothetical protein
MYIQKGFKLFVNLYFWNQQTQIHIMAFAAIIVLTVELFVNWNFRLFIYIFYFCAIISVVFKKKASRYLGSFCYII